MSLVSAMTGMYNLLTASGPYLTTEVSTCSFDPLESSSGCSITVFPGKNTHIQELTFSASGIDWIYWDIEGDVWVKDTGDPLRLLGIMDQAHDDLRATIQKDRTLGGTVKNAHLTALSFDPETAYQGAGGEMWERLHFIVEADEYA